MACNFSYKTSSNLWEKAKENQEHPCISPEHLQTTQRCRISAKWPGGSNATVAKKK